VKIYENLDALPRAFMVYDWEWRPDTDAAVAAMAAPGFNPARTAVLTGALAPAADGSPPGDGRGTVEIVVYAPERVVMSVNGDAGLLLLADALYPGWQATVDGEPVVIYAADGLLRGVFVADGAHEVVFTFRPRSLHTGAAVSLVGLFTVAMLALWAARLGGGRR